MLRLAAALVLGGLIGLERERQERAAGLRTVTMVSLGSCLFTLIGAYGFGAPARVDPTRIAAQVVTGIGFSRLPRIDETMIQSTRRTPRMKYHLRQKGFFFFFDGAGLVAT